MARTALGDTAARIVDINQFKARRKPAAAPRASASLPLFDGTPAPADPPAATPVARERRLSQREVQHRERMLAFLTAPRSG